MANRITPFFLFNNQSEEAARFYTSIFPNSKIIQVSRYTEAGPAAAGSVMMVSFELDGQSYTALNGGPNAHFTEAVSFVVHCKTQQEVDHYWDKLVAGGEPIQCGWLKDKFGMRWQIVPDALLEWIQDKDTRKAGNVMKAMMQMVKLDIAALQKAYQQA